MSDVEQVGISRRLRPEILVGGFYACTEMSCSMPWPTWVVEHGAGQRDQIGIPRADNGFRLLELGNQANGYHGHPRRSLDRPRQWHLVAGADGDALGRIEASTRDMDRHTTTRLERLCESDGLINVPPSLHPIGTRDASRDAPIRRKRSAHGVKNFERETHAVREAAAVLI